MKTKLILTLVLATLLLHLSVQNAMSSLTVTTANDYVQLTDDNPVTYTGTGIGTYTITASSYNAVGTLQLIRSSSALDYIWSATPDFPHTKGVGIRAVDYFTLSAPVNFQLTFTGRYLDGYLWNTETGTYVEKFGYKSGNVGPSPDFTILGSLLSGNYELRINTGAVPTDSPRSGEVHFTTSPVPIPGALWLLGSGLVGLIGVWRSAKKYK